MELGQVFNITQLSLLVIILWRNWEKNSTKTEKIVTSVAVLESSAKASAEDHDNLVRQDEKIKKLELDLNRAYEMIRDIKGEKRR